MVAEQHRVADVHVRAQPAARVGQDDRAATCRGCHAHAVHDRVDAAALVQVGAAEEGQHPLAAHVERPDPAGVALDGGRQEAGQVGAAELAVRLAERVDGRYPARSEHDRHVVALVPGQALGRRPRVRLLVGLGARTVGCTLDRLRLGWFGRDGRNGHGTTR